MTVTAIGSREPFYLDRMGWYYRSSQDQYEFWWMGTKPMITLSAFMLDVMPSDIAYEIKTSVVSKVDLLD